MLLMGHGQPVLVFFECHFNEPVAPVSHQHHTSFRQETAMNHSIRDLERQVMLSADMEYGRLPKQQYERQTRLRISWRRTAIQLKLALRTSAATHPYSHVPQERGIYANKSCGVLPFTAIPGDSIRAISRKE